MKTKKWFLALTTSALLFTGCSTETEDENGIIIGSFTDSRDEQLYRTVTIGTQTWLAENLNYAASGSKCGGTDRSLTDENTVNCDKYGRLYDWATAMNLPSDCNSISCTDQISSKHKGVCPDGWHISSYEEWISLIDYIIDDRNYNCASGDDGCKVAKHLAVKGWLRGDDSYGFAALPGGWGHSGTFSGAGQVAYWWIPGHDGGQLAMVKKLGERFYTPQKSELHSIRCLQD